jgi:hypothetical protein
MYFNPFSAHPWFMSFVPSQTQFLVEFSLYKQQGWRAGFMIENLGENYNKFLS